MKRAKSILIPSIVLWLSISCPSYAQDLYIHPANTDSYVGASSTMDVMVRDITALSTFEFRILFDKDILQAVSVAKGSLWSGPDYLWHVGGIDNTSGVIGFTLGAACLDSVPVGVSVDGALATITFQAIAEGASQIDLTDALVYNVNGDGVTGVNVADGSMNINPVVTLVHEFSKGWNAASCPGDPVISDVATLVSGTSVLPYADRWNPSTSGYETIGTLECGPSYWFSATEATQLTIQSQPRSTLTCQIKGGWNMVGSVSGSVPVSSLTSEPAGAVLQYIYRWNPDTLLYDLVDTIEPGGGHWVGATCDATLTIDSAAPPTAPAIQAQTVADSTKPSWESVVAIQTQSQHRELVFGMHPFASRRFDKSLDRPSPPLPAWMSGEIVKAGWISGDPHFSLLSESFVEDSSHATWELSIELSEAGEFQWKHLPMAYCCLLWYDGQTIRMQNGKSIPLSAGKHNLRLILDVLPKRTQLLANYPNPCNPETWIPYRLAKHGDVSLIIYNMLGKEVRQFHLHDQLAGEYQDKENTIYWDGKNQTGELVSSGVYFYSLQTAEVTQTRKLVIIR